MSERPHDDVRDLLRIAGRRPPVPPGRAERAREAARGAWRATVARRRRRRRWAWAAVGAAAAALAIAFLAPRPAVPTPEPGPGVEALVGEVRVEGTDARPGEIAWGATVETGASGRIAVRLPSGHAVRVAPETSLRLARAGLVDRLAGTVYVDSGDRATPLTALAVRTPLGEVREIGTRFEVRAGGGALRVRVREGLVDVRAAGRTERLEAGAEIAVGPDGVATRRPIAAHDPAWDWTLAVTRVPDFRGKPASEFLAWVARERGWSIAYGSEAAVRAAEGAILGGSLEDLGIDDALAAAAMASGLAWRIEDGTLAISQDTSSSAPGDR